MSNIYSEISIKSLEPMKVASYRIISQNPEEEVMEYMNNWARKNELNKQENMRNFGFDVPVSKEQAEKGLRGYEYWLTVSDTAVESDKVKIKYIEADEYAVLRITNPFENPFDTIPQGWKQLNDWVMNGEYKTTNYNNRYWLEEVIQEGNTTYMDIYYPVKDGGRKPKAEIVKFSVVELESCKLIGKEIRCMMGHPQGNPIPAFWEKCNEDDTMKSIQKHPDRVYSNACAGWMGRFDPADNTFSYIVGIFVKPDADVPEGLISIHMPKCRCAVATMQGIEPDVYINAHCSTEAEMKKQGLQFNESLGFEMEWYDERFAQNEGYKVIDLYMPVL